MSAESSVAATRFRRGASRNIRYNPAAMSAINRIYQPHALSLLTDLYQLTMAYGYWKLGMAERRAAFHLTFRANPFRGGYSVCCGLHDVIDFINSLRFQPDDLEYLASLRGNDDRPLF